MSKVDLETAIQHGLNENEFEKIKVLIGRVPNLTDLGGFPAM